VKIFLSSDMEGTAGIVDWAQCSGDGWEAVAGRALLLAEVNAAIDGALAAGATEIVVNDSHSVMRNLAPDQLHGRAGYISGRHKPLYMMQGLDASFDAVFFVSYHGSINGSPAILPHTYNPRAVAEVRLNGAVVGESGINALVAAHHGVPIVLVTGDQTACAETEAAVPGVHTAVVKQSLSRSAAASLHPARACELIEQAARQAVSTLSEARPPQLPAPSTLEVSWRTADMAEQAGWVRGVERCGERLTRLRDDDLLAMYRAFVSAVVLNRDLAADM
jgi:D-amino peptidase